MIRSRFIILLCCFVMSVGLAQVSQSDSRITEPSFNDQGVQHIEAEEYWQAIQSFERALRMNGRQRRVAKENLQKFKADVDLPAHTLLHFGWVDGLGKVFHRLPSNSWLILSLLTLVGLLYLLIATRYLTWKRGAILCFLSILFFVISCLRSNYIQAPDLIIFKTASDLKDKPYDVSSEKQIVFEGQMARVEQRYEGYLFVQTDTYESGWVSETDVIGVWED